MPVLRLQNDLNNPKKWKRTAKKKYDIYVCRPEIGAKVTNVLEGAHYVTDQNKQFVLSGTAGETCVIDFTELCKNYNLIGGQPLDENVIKSRLKGEKMDWVHIETKTDGAGLNFAFHLDPDKYGQECRNFPIATSWGDTLIANRDDIRHGVGDFLVCATGTDGQPNLADMWVVNGEIFPDTYDMRAFPGLSKMLPNGLNSEKRTTPVPKSILKESDLQNVTKTVNKEGEKGRGRNRTEFQIVGRYMNGKNVTGYHLQSISNGKSVRLTKEQVCFLVGRGQVTNCKAQLVKDDLILRGKGMNLTDLPIINDEGELRNTDGIGKIKRGTSAVDAVNQLMIIGTIKSGKNVVGYVLQNAGCGIKRVERNKVLELAAQGRIGNADVQKYNGEVLLRGVGINLSSLPSEKINTNSEAEHKKKTKKGKLVISQFKKPDDIRLEAGLIDFWAPTKEELHDIMDKARMYYGFGFNNTNEICNMKLNGEDYYMIFDDPYINSLSGCISAAEKLGLGFGIADNFVILDDNAEEIDMAQEGKENILKQIGENMGKSSEWVKAHLVH